MSTKAKAKIVARKNSNSQRHVSAKRRRAPARSNSIARLVNTVAAAADTAVRLATEEKVAEAQAPAAGVEPETAFSLLATAADAIDAEGKARGLAEGERSMGRTVEAFNALTGNLISERDGWLFMAMLKAARATAGLHQVHDYRDGAAYFALAGECAENRERRAVAERKIVGAAQ